MIAVAHSILIDHRYTIVRSASNGKPSRVGSNNSQSHSPDRCREPNDDRARARRFIERLAEKYLRSDTERSWRKTFPDEFYEQIYRLRGWTRSRENFHFRPAILGHLTNDIVYDRLVPGLRDALEDRNPLNRRGRRAVRHHQLLTEDYGLPALQRHLQQIIMLMKVSQSWAHFKSLLAKHFPKEGEQLSLILSRLR
ncbi:P63C domain-containing protein [Longibacter sp.]|uniref:P63C domain-containing protein n=1 Tax=Longibacter sp. TaxID=2045415 RepID=UPI003EB6B5D8